MSRRTIFETKLVIISWLWLFNHHRWFLINKINLGISKNIIRKSRFICIENFNDNRTKATNGLTQIFVNLFIAPKIILVLDWASWFYGLKSSGNSTGTPINDIDFTNKIFSNNSYKKYIYKWRWLIQKLAKVKTLDL